MFALQQRAIEHGDLGWEFELSGDQHGHRHVVDAVREARPDDAILSEEGSDDRSRVHSKRAWIIDPVDGSSGFGAGNQEWAVHVALSVNGVATVGAVAVPGLSMVGSTAVPPSISDSPDRAPVVVTGRSRGWQEGRRIASALGGELLVCSSAGVKAMMVATGVADVYVHDAPLYEWDVCAPAVVAQAAGLHVSDCAGDELVFNKINPVVPGLLISRAELVQEVTEILLRHAGDHRR